MRSLPPFSRVLLGDVGVAVVEALGHMPGKHLREGTGCRSVRRSRPFNILTAFWHSYPGNTCATSDRTCAFDRLRFGPEKSKVALGHWQAKSTRGQCGHRDVAGTRYAVSGLSLRVP